MMWTDLYDLQDAAPGLVRGVIEIRHGNKAVAQVALEVEVLALTLPERDVARLGAVNFGSLLEEEKIDPARLRRWMQVAHAHHLSIELMKPTPKQGKDGSYDWEGYARRFSEYL